QLFPAYIKTLQNFNLILKQRNYLLRSIANKEAHQTELDLWDERLSSAASELFSLRWQVVQKLNQQVKLIFTRLTGKDEALTLTYGNFLDAEELFSNEDAQARYQDLLMANREIDLERGLTTTGPQRDDLLIEINGLDSRDFASQGQQRTVMIALRLAEAYLLWQYFNESPIILLDDVLSELDEQHQLLLFKELPPETQTLLTTVNVGYSVFNGLAGTFFNVTDGKIKKIEKL
ncbi:MAG: DNA replication and repair protein RecF, partial [Candidatus Sumerlaeia bacterium]|nr:DNA replication and repair protein RecF [Candidatus Sumerlaeia bacterium]